MNQKLDGCIIKTFFLDGDVHIQFIRDDLPIATLYLLFDSYTNVSQHLVNIWPMMNEQNQVWIQYAKTKTTPEQRS